MCYHAVWSINMKESLQIHHEGDATRNSRPPSIVRSWTHWQSLQTRKTTQGNIYDAKTQMEHHRTETNLNWRNSYMYKEVDQLKALIAVPISYQPSLATVRGTRNSHCLKFVPHHCRINVYQLLFFPWIIFYWNTLPESIILSPLLEQFKTSTSIQNLQHWTTCPAY